MSEKPKAGKERGERSITRRELYALMITMFVSGFLLSYFFGERQARELQMEVVELTSQVSSLQSQLEDLELRIVILQNIYTTGPTLVILSGGYEDKVSPPFYIPAGNVKITVQLTGLGEIRVFSISLCKIGQKYPVWVEITDHAGFYESYLFSLEPGDYFLNTSSVNFKWQVTVQVFG